jgi:16S rRNA (uracil1498-N3)-methyltransferase
MEIFYQPEILGGVNELPPEESKHCVKVMRHESGDVIHVTDGRGALYKVRIKVASPKKCTFIIISHTRKEPKSYWINLAIAPTKSSDRTELLIEKAVEFGVDEISFYFGRHSERRKINIERLEKKAIVAMKQSQQYKLPKIKLYQSFKGCLDASPDNHQKLIAHVDSTNQYHLLDVAEPGKHYTVFIGPEGDFSEEEIIESFKAGYTKVSLGKNRLRTETAGLAACHILNLINR